MIDLRLLHTDYRQKVEAVRDETLSPEARSAAEAAMIEARHALDDALVKADEERQDSERREAVERAADISHRAAMSTGAPDVVGEQRKVMREFLTHGSPRTTLRIGFPDPEHRATTDPIISTDASATYASYLVPDSIWGSVNLHVNAQSGVLKTNATVLYTAGGNTMYLPTLTTDPVAALHAEAAAATQNNFVVAQPQLDAYRVDGFFGVSKEFLDDTLINGEAFLGDLAGRAIATTIAGYASVGTGSSEPQGINDATEITSVGVTAASATTFTMDELISLRYSVLPGYAARGEWVFGSAAYVILAKMKNDEGSYYWMPSVAAGEPDRLLGKPCYEDSGFEAPTTGLCPVFFGDFSNYWTRWSHGGIEFTRDDSFAFTSFTSTFRYAAWWDAELLHPTLSVKHLLMG